ncbi:MAG: nucleotidyltransferase family protein [Phycisphaerae bacterium]
MDTTSAVARLLRFDHIGRAAWPASAAAWERVVDAARAAGVSGLLLERLSASGLDAPLAAVAALRASGTACAVDIVHAMAELERVVGWLDRCGVPVMLLKGAALHLTIYDRPDARPMTDVDVLIRPESVSAAVRALDDFGCRRARDLVRTDFFPRYHYEIDYVTPSPRPVRVDLHARAFRPLRMARTMPDDGLWHGATPVAVGASRAWVPGPEAMMIHLAAHAAFHGCARLLWLYDVNRYADAYRDAIDWHVVADLARDWRVSLPVAVALRRATAVLGRVVPPGIIDELASHRVTWRDRLALAQAPRDIASPTAHVAVNLLCTPGVRFRCGYLAAMLLPGRRHLAEVYRFRHPGWTHCARAWRLCRGVARMAALPIACIVRAVSQRAGRIATT